MPYVYAPLQKKLLPDVGETKKALQMLKAERNPDPRPIMSILSQLPQADLHLLGLMQTRKLAPLGWPFIVEPSDANDPKAVEIALRVRDRLVRSKIHHKFGVLIGSIFYGVAGIHCPWESKSGEWVAETKTVSSLSLWIRSGVPNLIEDTSQLHYAPIENPEQYVIATFNPFEEVIADYTGGLFRTAMWLVIIKHFNWSDWSKFNEIFVQPYRMATWAAGTSESDKAVARQAVEQIGSDAWAAFPDTVKIEFIEAVKSGSVQAYKDLLRAADDALSIMILGQTLTTDVRDRGSFAAAKVHSEVRADYMWHDLQMIEQAVNEQYISQDYRLNYGNDVTLRPRFRFQTDESPDFEKNARIIGELKSQGIPLKRSEVYEKTGFTPPEDGDEVV